MKTLLLFMVLSFLSVSSLCGEMIVTYQGKESPYDTRRCYQRDLLKLALEKTKDKYGGYSLIGSPMMNSARSLAMAQKHTEYINFFVRQSVYKDLMDEMGYVAFPVDLGIVGYRVFFVSTSLKPKLKNIKTIDELKQFSIGQGIGWLDTDILRSNGFNVIVGGSYDGLFEMVAAQRFDLFSRGVNELYDEYNAFKWINGLDYDEGIAIYYPLPRFFFTHKSNKEAIQRVEEGLITAFNDGSLIDLWEKYYGESIKFVNLKKRKLFKIVNPYLDGVDKSYEKYLYHP